MPSTITRSVFEGYVNCRRKGYLRLLGEPGNPSDYACLLSWSREQVRTAAISRMDAEAGDGQVMRGAVLDRETLARGAPFIIEPVWQDGACGIVVDALKRTDGASDLGHYHYVPVVFHGGEQIQREQKLLLGLYGSVLARLQGRPPARGEVIHGSNARPSRIAMGPVVSKADKILDELAQMVQQSSAPKLLLNRHCDSCEFRSRCHDEAIREDSISLLRGMSEKEINDCAKKGIFTLTQFSYTFRPRRAGRRRGRRGNRHSWPLQAMAIREGKTYVLGSFQVPQASAVIYWDAEGDPDRNSIYLIGLIVVANGSETRYSFWADGPQQEDDILASAVGVLGQHEDHRLFHYGSYEANLLRTMKKRPAWRAVAEKAEANATNMLSLLRNHVYFPVFSNGLKEVGGHLGFRWSDADASGLQSIVWRRQWERNHEEAYKQKLIRYNLEDCAALRVVTERIRTIQIHDPSAGQVPPEEGNAEQAERVPEQLPQQRWGRIHFAHADYEQINRAAYFDYQRERVYVRTNASLRQNLSRADKQTSRTLRASCRQEITAETCPTCGARDLAKTVKRGRHTKRVLDLRITPGSIRRWVAVYSTAAYHCRTCNRQVAPREYERLSRHGHGLMSWAMCEHVTRATSLEKIQAMFKEYFGLKVSGTEIRIFRELVAAKYKPVYDSLLQKILSGRLAHVDETEVLLKSGKAYVWVFTNLEEVVFMYRPTREGSFLTDLMRGFRGVLISDFYSPYNALDCPQQKCLIHLIRDMNQDLLRNPFDDDLKGITSEFGALLRGIVETIDQHGLKHRWLGRHESSVDGFFDRLETRMCRSEVAGNLRARLLKYRDKLFTFIQYDGVPWNNNNAENAIRQFVFYRRATVSLLSERGLTEYLVLLSLCHTCRYKGIDFLAFLLSEETDIDALSAHPRPRRWNPRLEVYPEGYIPWNLKMRPNAGSQ